MVLGDRWHDNDPSFWTFKHQLYHSSLAAILQSIKPAMTIPVVHHCPDGHFCQDIYDLGPFIANYLEQVMLTGTVQGGWCPKYVLYHYA
jgi:Plavaka transposase